MASPLYDANRDYTKKPYASIVAITPEIAARWLERNKSNRKLKEHKIAGYARDMKAGNWQFTGEAIKFSANGELLDGQNRLHAVIRSGCTVLIAVFRGIDPGAQSVMDSGASRSVSDNIHMQGHQNATVVASIARLAVRRENARDTWLYRPTNSEIQEWVSEHPEVQLAAKIACHARKNTDITPTIIGFTTLLIAEVAGFDRVEQFWNTAASRVGLYEHDPIIALTNAFGEVKRKRARVSEMAQVSAVLRAYNARQQGQPMKLVRFTYSDAGQNGQHKHVAIPAVWVG